ncbi:MAG: hypothetical protein JW832_08315 [Deltaproteobacteria bacterium]|nr:hypothetical protein [Deltaproteobacteria bacterium]
MKGKLFLGLIVAVCFVLPAQSVQAFDPGAWLKQGIIKLDTKAAEDMTRRENIRKDFSSGKNHNDTVRQIKKYLKSETAKSSRPGR